MFKFPHNNAKKANIGYTSFMLNCCYYLKILYKDNIQLSILLNTVEKLLAKM